jgi:exopolysaccharide biosynthesis polyprenyl glycosylphosphotransferase
MAAAAVALTLGVVVLGGDRVTLALAAAIPLVVLVSKVAGLYDRDEHLLHKTTLDEAPAIFQLATLYTFLIWLGEDAFVVEGTALADAGDLGRGQVLGLWGLLFVSLLVARTVAREVARRLTSTERCLVLGGSEAAKGVESKFRGARRVDAAVVGRVPLEPGEVNGAGPVVLGGLDELEGLLARHEVDRVIVAPTTADSEQLLYGIRRAKSLGVKVSVLPRLFEVVGSSVRFDDVEGLVLLGVPRWGLSTSSMLLKRSVDLLGSAAGLLALAPLFAAIAAVVKVSSRGPVFFHQARIGRDGKQFQMLKFRTMYDGADEAKAELLDLNEADGLFKIANDPRLTDVGRVLRRFSLDELPQLINVLRGEMSLVGPRPLVGDDDRLVTGWQRRRLDVPPGMTGIWQVLGSSRVPLHEMVKIDYLYGANWSLWLDIKILLRTIPHMVARRGL